MRGPIALLFLTAGVANAVIVDRIAITVGDRIITDSEILQRLRLTAFQNAASVDLSAAAREKAAQMLIDRKIVEREMDVGHYPALPDRQRQELIDGFAKENYNGDRGALTQALAGYGLSVKDLQDDLARQSDLLTFLSLRFRPAVQVSDAEVQRYFREKVQPEKRSVSLNDVRAAIEQLIIQERADADLEAWLRNQRKNLKIVYLEADLKEPEATR